jgi:hypothetical protein
MWWFWLGFSSSPAARTGLRAAAAPWPPLTTPVRPRCPSSDAELTRGYVVVEQLRRIAEKEDRAVVEDAQIRAGQAFERGQGQYTAAVVTHRDTDVTGTPPNGFAERRGVYSPPCLMAYTTMNTITARCMSAGA